MSSFQNQQEIKEELTHLYQEHRDLDDAIISLEEKNNKDLIQIQRLKKRKLIIKDKIKTLEDSLLPDIIA